MQKVERVALQHRVALGVVAPVALVILALLPLALASVLRDVVNVPHHHTYSLSAPESSPALSHARLHVELIALDAWGQLATLRVSGHHICPSGCTGQVQVLFVALRTDNPAAQGLPPSATVTLPTAGQITQTIQLPVSGRPIRYPFDTYELPLGVVLQQVQADGTVQTLTPDEAQGLLFLTVQNRLPLLSAEAQGGLGPQSIRVEDSPYPYLYAERFALHRPAWLPMLAVLLVALITAAAAIAVFLRPLLELVVGVGSLVLGVWGVRSVLLPSSITYTTAVDLSLSVVLLFLLGAITVRSLVVLWDRNQLPRPGRSRARSAPPGPELRNSPNGNTAADMSRIRRGERRNRR
jgi:hypothetical protein